jgi:hypothetical protein
MLDGESIMKRLVLFMITCCTVFLLGCKDDPVREEREWDSDWVTGIEVRASVKELTAPAGVMRTFGISAIAYNGAGVGKPDVELSLSVLEGTGQITPRTGVTDEIGRVFATYSTFVSSGQSIVKLKATTGQFSGEKQFTINGLSPPSNISLIPETSELTVPENTNGSIRLETVISDSLRVGVPGVQLRYEISEFSQESLVFGSIFGSNITDQNGRAEAMFMSDLGSGTVNMSVFIDEIGFEHMFARVPLTVNILDEESSMFNIFAYPTEHHNIHHDSLVSSKIIITVKDKNRVGIPNLKVRLNTDIGKITEPLLTDSAGMTTAQHTVRPSADVEHNEEFTATISAEVPDAGGAETTTVRFYPRRVYSGSLSLISNRDSFCADGTGGNQAILTAVLKDKYGQIIQDEELIFTSSSPDCIVISPIVTNSMGIARTVVDDNRVPIIDDRGVPVPVGISAYCPSLELESTIEISIRDGRRVSLLNVLSYQRYTYPGNSLDIHISGYLSDGSRIPDYIKVYFTAKHGSWLNEVVQNNINTYLAPECICIDSCSIFVINPNDTLRKNFNIEIMGRLPYQIVAIAEPNQIRAGIYTDASVTARVLDYYGFSVGANQNVWYRDSQGGIVQLEPTDKEGMCSANFSLFGSEEDVFITTTVFGRGGAIEDSVEIEVIGVE